MGRICLANPVDIALAPPAKSVVFAGGLAGLGRRRPSHYSRLTSSRATMLMILISGLMAGPAVSL